MANLIKYIINNMKHITNFVDKLIKDIKNPRYLIILLISLFLSPYIKLTVFNLLSSRLAITQSKLVIFILTFIISMLLFRIIVTFIDMILNNFRGDNKKLKEESIPILEYYPVSIENLEHWAKIQGLHDKVPEDI